MSNAKPFDESMSDLRLQLGALDTDDDRVPHLKSLADDIEMQLGSSGNIENAPLNLGDRVTTSILQFEGSHPRITTILNELAQKLSDIGI